jgi:hypothetical protein
MAKESVINLTAVYAPYFVEVGGKGLQQVMDVAGFGEETDGLYVRKNSEWVKPENSSLEYQYKGDGEYLPGDLNSIAEESYEEALNTWDEAEKSGEPVYSNKFYPYLLENYEGTIKQEVDEG